MALAVVLGGGSLLLFGAFLVVGPFGFVRLADSETQVRVWDGVLSLLFFAQHSGMVRRGFRERFESWLPEHFEGAAYAIASGVVLTTVVLLWQSSTTVVFEVDGPLRWLFRGVTALAVAGFVWGVRSLRRFDAFGVEPVRSRLHGGEFPEPRFELRGPYLWVRHPLYTCMLALIWSAPDVTADRLLFNVLWTLWIVAGAHLEERDLVAQFGECYRRYRQLVPMLVPWRGPAGRGRIPGVGSSER